MDMSRFVVVVALLVACDRGAPPQDRPTIPRAKLDTSALRVALPVRGYALLTQGMGTYTLEVVDSSARTMRLILNTPQLDRTLSLDASQVRELDQLADDAWREVQHGPLPQAFDIVQELFIVDHEAAFYLRGYPIEDSGGYSHTGRPLASKLVLAIEGISLPRIESAIGSASP